MVRRVRKIQHAPYVGSTDSDGYPSGDTYGAVVERDSWGWYPLSSQLSPAGEYDRRVVTSKVVLVPDPTVFAPRDRIALTGGDITDDAQSYFVSEDMRDYSTGPYRDDFECGEIVIEKVSG